MVKLALGALIQPARLGGQKLPRHVQVYRTVLDAILSGKLPPGARLPSARQLAMDWGVTRGAVDAAFDLLHQEGCLVRRVGDGSYVAQPLPATLARLPSAPPVALRGLSRSAQHVLDRFAPYMGKPLRLDVMQDVMRAKPLFPRAPLLEDFPLPQWRRLVADAFADDQHEALSYGPAVGMTTLGEAIARHLTLTRATPCTAAQVMVVNSPMQGIELISRVLLEQGDKVWTEDPGHASLPALLRVLHQEPVPVPLDAQGLNVAAGRALAHNAAAVYFHPGVQFPTGIRTSNARRRELMDWADEVGAWIIEGNFNDELAHDRNAPESLQAIDRNDRVLTMGTFEGILYPSLRLAYLVVPERLMKVFMAMRGLMGDHSSVAMQHATTRFPQEGHMATRLRQMRARIEQRRTSLVAAMAKHLPAWVQAGPLDGDGHACLHLPLGVADLLVNDVHVATALRQKEVLSFALSSLCMKPYGLNAIVINYAAFSAAEIDTAMAAFGAVLKESGSNTGPVVTCSAHYQGAGEKT